MIQSKTGGIMIRAKERIDGLEQRKRRREERPRQQDDPKQTVKAVCCLSSLASVVPRIS